MWALVPLSAYAATGRRDEAWAAAVGFARALGLVLALAAALALAFWLCG
jgi:hypothetical protein